MPTPPSSGRSPLEIAKLFLKAFEPLAYDNALALVAEACEYTNPAGIRAVLEPFFAPTLENEIRILREASQGPIVVLERLDRHRLADKWVELPVTGVFEVHGGLITYWRDYFDAATILSQWPGG